MRSRPHLALLLALLALAGACARKKKAPLPAALPAGSVEYGIASWYGAPYHGRVAADGEIYDMETMVAAHRTLPFGWWVRVENLENHKTVEVRIIDRGPFIDGRIIDLSHAAARAIDLIGPGTARVKLEIITPPPASSSPIADLFAVQVGAFRDRARAERLRSAMEKQYGAAHTTRRDGAPPVWRVVVGRESTMESAAALALKLKSQGTNAFVVRLDEGY